MWVQVSTHPASLFFVVISSGVVLGSIELVSSQQAFLVALYRALFSVLRASVRTTVRVPPPEME